MIQKLFKTLLAASLFVVTTPINAKCKLKCETLCTITVKNKLNVEGNATINGTLTVAGVNFNSLTGIAGAVGAAGPAGAQGIAGVIGAIGAAGAAGAPGTPGLPGIPGIGGILGWGYIYNLAAQTIPIEATVPFDSNGPLSGITHAPGSDAINITNAGIYAIFFSVSGTQPNQFALAVNGSPSTSTIYGSGAGTQQNTGLTILTLSAGDVITLINHSSSAAVGLASVIGGTQANVNASVLLLRIA